MAGPVILTDQASGDDLTPRGLKTRALLAYLALQGSTATTRRRLANLLWGDRFEQQARGSLRQALSELRLSDIPIEEGNGGVRLAPGVVTIDIMVALDALRHDDPSKLERIHGQPNLSFFDDLDGITSEFDEWVEIERAQLIARTLTIGGDEAQRMLDQGKIGVARKLLSCLTVIDPAQERTVSLAMRVDHAGGDITTLHRRFRAHRTVLREELGVEPSATVTALYRQLVGAGSSADLEADPAKPVESANGDAMVMQKDRHLAPTLAMAAAAFAGIAVLAAWPHHAPTPASGPVARALDPALVRANGLIRQRTRPAYAEAEALLRQLVARDPANATAWARLGVAVWMPWWWKAQVRPAAKEELRAEAIGYARRALTIDRNSAAGNASLGLILTDTADGVLPLERAVAIEPDNAESWLWLGNARASRRDEPGALEAYRRATTIEPGWYRTVDPYCRALHRLGRREQAFSLLEHYERTADDRAHATLQRAKLLMTEGRLTEAARAAFGNLATRPANPWYARQLLLQVALRLDDRTMIGRLAGADSNVARALAAVADNGNNLEHARHNPDGWWTGTNLGERARQLLGTGHGDVLLSLYDRRYPSARDFHDHNIAFDAFAPPLALALHQSGRRDAAAEIERLLQQDVALATKQGVTTYEPALGGAWLASLRGDGPGAARLLDLAVRQGWRGQDPEYGPAPDQDPLFGPVANDPSFRAAVASFHAALAIEGKRFAQENFSHSQI